MWSQPFNYCLQCRSQHRDETVNRRKKGKPDSLPLCDTSDGTRCERIRSWHDGKKEHKEPLQLLPGNYLAMEMYTLVAQLSDHDVFRKNKSDKMYSTTFHTLSALGVVLSTHASELEEAEVNLLLKKIGIIHQIKLREHLAGV